MAKQNLKENHQCCSSSRDLNWGPTTDGIEQRKKVQHTAEINHWPFSHEAFAQPCAQTCAQRHGEFQQQVLEMLFAFKPIQPNSKKSSPTSVQRFFEWLESVLVARSPLSLHRQPRWTEGEQRADASYRGNLLRWEISPARIHSDQSPSFQRKFLSNFLITYDDV